MPKYDVFLSHNSTDKSAVEELARRLVDKGRLTPFLSINGILFPANLGKRRWEKLWITATQWPCSSVHRA